MSCEDKTVKENKINDSRIEHQGEKQEWKEQGTTRNQECLAWKQLRVENRIKSMKHTVKREREK